MWMLRLTGKSLSHWQITCLGLYVSCSRQHNFGLDNLFGPLGDPGFNPLGNRHTHFGSTNGVNDHTYHRAGHDNNFNANNQDDTQTLEDDTRMTGVTMNVDHKALQSIFGLSGPNML
ncbi:hypothetical protein KEM48_005101 [Puccinia striiformis f. sp. tritici PST-130]|nr:hypothetical protein KEM48_005101 [Puccinia striiformis f. sp. tritici PST-130]